MNACILCKVISLSFVGMASALLFVWSLCVDYQRILALEHIQFRRGFPSQVNWITSPYGTLNCYLFNVTNSEEFKKGIDKKLKLKEVGPIVYRVKGRNQILNQTNTSITYRKIRYDEMKFDPEASCAPDILNQTIVLPNLVLLGAAAKLHDWIPMIRPVFTAISSNEPVFLNKTIYYFLWDFTTPALDLLSRFIPNIVSNCGMLYNAVRRKDEVYNVQIGLESGINNFFRVNKLNGKTYFPEQEEKLRFLKKPKNSEIYCPIEVGQSFDNSVFPPYVNPNSSLTIVAAESCRTLRLKFNDTVEHLGFLAYQFIITDTPTTSNCLSNAMGIKLHSRMFDVSKCLFNDVPAAFSSPHFYGSSYNWSVHFEGLEPYKDSHEASIIIEPLTGIPIEEKYRFQSNIPMPDMSSYSDELRKFSSMVVPSFWYEYDLDDLPENVLFLMRLNIFFVPILQPILIIIFFLLSLVFFTKSFLILRNVTLKQLLCMFRTTKIDVNI